ncbi:class D sortase [Bacillus marinisedimentorum]|uniref:class D sortase n=1 Tax=Bacillus marinisedimentorum TaxID=1821260 RepID=UPI0009F3397B|nr:class D sortase [Bacillus marinisedimentorum]
MIISGIWFTGTNGYKFLKGYFLYKTGVMYTEDKPVKSEIDTGSEKAASPSIQNVPLYENRPQKGDHVGELFIPKLEARLPIYHGTDEDELEKGVGHFADSVLPGEKDNSVLSGHRDTVFRSLGKVGKGDLLIARTSAGEFTYKVRQVRIVDEDDRTVIVPKPKATLTVSTCYPFDFIGSAPERYILVADLIRKQP